MRGAPRGRTDARSRTSHIRAPDAAGNGPGLRRVRDSEPLAGRARRECWDGLGFTVRAGRPAATAAHARRQPTGCHSLPRLRARVLPPADARRERVGAPRQPAGTGQARILGAVRGWGAGAHAYRMLWD